MCIGKGFYDVTFTQNHTYSVTADTEEDAVDLAERKFREDMLRPVAKTWYDEVDVELVAVCTSD